MNILGKVNTIKNFVERSKSSFFIRNDFGKEPHMGKIIFLLNCHCLNTIPAYFVLKRVSKIKSGILLELGKLKVRLENEDDIKILERLLPSMPSLFSQQSKIIFLVKSRFVAMQSIYTLLACWYPCFYPKVNTKTVEPIGPT